MIATIELPSGQQITVDYYYTNYPDINDIFINNVRAQKKVIARIEGISENELITYIEETIEEQLEEARANRAWNRADDLYDLLRDNYYYNKS